MLDILASFEPGNEKQPSSWLILDAVLNNRIHEIVKKMKIKPDMDIFFGNYFDIEGRTLSTHITDLYKLYYEYKLKNFHGDFMRELKNNNQK